MKATMLKLAGVKSEAAFYKKFPTQEAFMKVHGKAFNKAKLGAKIDKAQFGKPVSYDQDIEMPEHIVNPNWNQAKSETYQQDQLFGAVGENSASLYKAADVAGKIGGYAKLATGLIDAGKAYGAEKNKLAGLVQQNQVVGLQRRAQNSEDVDLNRMNKQLMWNPTQDITSGNQVHGGQGTGTNILSGKYGRKLKGGGEIQNTYAPNTLYDDLGYEPVKAAAGGSFSNFMGAGGTDMANKLVGGMFDNNAGYQAGAAIGNIAKAIPGVGSVVGAVAAPVLGAVLGGVDQAFGPAGQIKKESSKLQRQTSGMQLEAGVRDYRTQHKGFMKDGGYVSNDWTPQVITKFGDHSAKDIYDFAHEGMESLRAGGQIRGEYTPVSEEGLQTYALGGEVETTWGGKVKPIARNPYLPNSGEIVEFKGNSHTESDGNGHKGIGVQYKTPDSYTEYAEFGSKTAQADVEVQGGEPGHIDDKGNFNVGGALRLVPKMAKQTGSPELIKLANKYDSMKVQDIIKKNADQTNNVNKKMIKVTDQLSSLKPVTSFEAIEQKSLEAMKDGYDKQLQGLAGEVNTITNWQTSVNDTVKDMSEKLGYKISADHLARYGTVKKDTDPVTKDSKAKIGKKLTKPEASSDIEMPTHINNRLYNKSASEEYQSLLPYDTIGDKEEQDAQALSYETLKDPESATNQNSWLTALNSVLPYVRPSNARPLDQRQILGELSALSMNQLEPVQAQRYNPQLTSSSTISLQDQINEITAQTRAAQRMAQGNPAAQAMIASQAYEAINKVKGEEFRTNQDRTDKTYAANINTLNDAQLKNLGIFSKQSADQSLAKSNTKAVQQAALQSISDKYLQNEAANKKLQVAENTYNYRYDSAGRLINMNPLQYFTPSGAESKSGGKGLAPGYEFTYDSDQNIIGTRKTSKEDVAKNGTKLKAKNGSIVKAIKNL